MKKLASLLTVFLLVLSLTLGMAIPAMAASLNGSGVDTNHVGTITLYKYEPNGNKSVPVSGAEFSAYRVLDFDGKTYTVNTNFTDVVTIDQAVNTTNGSNGTISYGTTTVLEKQIDELQNYINNNNISATAFNTTGTDGKAVLTVNSETNGQLGVYLVMETAAAKDHVLSSQPFLVSLPSWDQTADTDKDGKTGEWVYEVTAYPKNEKITVQKDFAHKDDDHGVNETEAKADSVSIGDKITYTVDVKIPYYGVINPDKESNQINVVDKMLIEAYAHEDVDGVARYNALNVEFKDVLSEGLTLDLESLKVEVLGAGVGNANVPLNKGTALKNLDSYTLKDGSIEKKKPVTTDGVNDYTAVEEPVTVPNPGTEMTVTVAWLSLDKYQGKTLRLTYDAVLNEKAVVGVENTNNVTYKYKNDPNDMTSDAEFGTTEDTNKIYTYEMDLTKTFNGLSRDKAGLAENVAKGVTFQLFTAKLDGDTIKTGTKLNVIEMSDGHYVIWTGAVEESTYKALRDNNGTTKTYVKTTAGADAVVTKDLHPDKDGELVIKGFEAGYYQLEETASVQGYTKLASPLTIHVEEVNGTDGVLTAKVKVSYADANDKNTGWVNIDNVDVENIGQFRLTVNNAKNQFNLPQTGGAGLWIFTVCGGIVMAAAIILFINLPKRKKH